MSSRGGYGARNQEDDMMQAMLIKMTMAINKQCFGECINSFKEDTLSNAEQTCIQSCAKRQSGAFAAMNDISQQLASKGGPGMF